MITVSEVELFIPETYLPPAELADDWEQGLANRAVRLKERIEKVIPDSPTFESKLAVPSARGYSPMVNPSFQSRGGLTGSEIIVNQEANLRNAYDKFKNSLDYMFETVDGIPAKRYKDALARKKQNVRTRSAQRGMPITGIKTEMMGAASIAVLWLTEDSRVQRFLRGSDKVKTGGPYLITPWRRINPFRAAMMGRLIQAGVQIIKSNLSTSVTTAFNDLINADVQSFVDPILGFDPFTTGGNSYLNYTKKNHQLWLEIKVSRV